MQDAGLIEVFIGVESADNEIKDNIHKGTTIEQDTEVLNWCKELGIICKTSFILGLPGETMNSMMKTREWILENMPDRVGLDRLIPFPGTPLTEQMSKYDLVLERGVPEEFFFRGSPDQPHPSFVSTSHLTRQQIDNFWTTFDAELRQLGVSG
jgi:radical SAM superfamily enzyme YgiQ (UPF0313 family)